MNTNNKILTTIKPKYSVGSLSSITDGLIVAGNSGKSLISTDYITLNKVRRTAKGVWKEIEFNKSMLLDPNLAPTPEKVFRSNDQNKLHRYSSPDIQLTLEENEEKIFIRRLIDIVFCIKRHELHLVGTSIDMCNMNYRPLNMTVQDIIDEISLSLSHSSVMESSKFVDSRSLIPHSSILDESPIPFMFFHHHYWTQPSTPSYFLVIEDKCINITDKSSLLDIVGSINAAEAYVPLEVFNENVAERYAHIDGDVKSHRFIMDLIYEFHDDYFADERGIIV